MALNVLQAAETINALEIFLDKRRPPEEMRSQLDLGYKIENQSIIIYEVRPQFMDENKTIESPIAKTTWVHAKEIWKIYWMRADLKWHAYPDLPQVKTIEEFLAEVNEDPHGCFWG